MCIDCTFYQKKYIKGLTKTARHLRNYTLNKTIFLDETIYGSLKYHFIIRESFIFLLLKKIYFYNLHKTYND